MIKSGIAKIDDFLNGGFQGGFITDIFGSSASGKTQLLFQICANSIRDGSLILFQDTKGEFRPERILEILKTFGKDEDLLENIKISRITNTNEQILDLSKITSDFSLIIIDNITELFSFEYDKDKQSLQRNKLFMKYMHELSSISIEKNIPVIVANTIRSIDDKEVENMGKAINLFSHFKIHLTKNGNSTSAELSTINKKTKFSFVITNRGVISTS